MLGVLAFSSLRFLVLSRSPRSEYWTIKPYSGILVVVSSPRLPSLLGVIVMSNHLPEQSADTATLVELLRRRAQQQPDQLAYTFLVDGETTEARLTYAELDQQA